MPQVVKGFPKFDLFMQQMFFHASFTLSSYYCFTITLWRHFYWCVFNEIEFFNSVSEFLPKMKRNMNSLGTSLFFASDL